MNLPESVWLRDLGDGSTLLTRIGRVEPTYMPISDLSAFRNVWKQRLEDASERNLQDLSDKSQAVLRFTAEQEQIVLLIWPATKQTALFAPLTERLLIL